MRNNLNKGSTVIQALFRSQIEITSLSAATLLPDISVICFLWSGVEVELCALLLVIKKYTLKRVLIMGII